MLIDSNGISISFLKILSTVVNFSILRLFSSVDQFSCFIMAVFNTRIVTKVIDYKSSGLVLHFLYLSDVTFNVG